MIDALDDSNRWRELWESRDYDRWTGISYECPICGLTFHGWEVADHQGYHRRHGDTDAGAFAARMAREEKGASHGAGL